MNDNGDPQPRINADGKEPQISADGKEPQINADKRGSETPHTLARYGTVTREVTQRLIGAYYEVYNELGFGFLENIYREAMAIELKRADFRVDRDPVLVVRYRGHAVGVFKPDLIVNDAIILEFKCSEAINDIHRAQLLNYLRASNVELGFLFNFGDKPTFERFVFDNTRTRPR